MLFLSIGVFEYAADEIYLDDNACLDVYNQLSMIDISLTMSELADRFGKNWDLLRSLDLIIIVEILGMIEAGSYIGWYDLKTSQIEISSTFHWREGTYMISLEFEGPGHGFLDDRGRCELAQALGDDLNQIRKLGRENIGWFLYGTGIVKCALVQPRTQPHVPTSLLPSGFPQTIQPLVNQVSPNYERRTSCFSSYPGKIMTDQQVLGNDIPTTPTLNGTEMVGATSYPTPPYSVNSPVGQSLALPSNGDSPVSGMSTNRLLSINPSVHSGAPPTPNFSSGSDVGSLSSPSSYSYPFNSPAAPQQLILPGTPSGHMPHNQTSAIPRMVLAPRQREVAMTMLRSCTFRRKDVTLDDDQIHAILRAATSLVTQDPSKMLRSLFEGAPTQKSLKRLGCPEKWEGINGGVNCLRVLDADYDKGNPFTLGPLARRTTQILLYINCERLRKRGETDAVDRILKAYVDDPIASKTLKARKNRFHAFHIRRGRWWWRLAALLGVGILLIGDEGLVELMINGKNTFTNDQIDALIAFILHSRPGTVQLFRSLEASALSVLKGEVPADFFEHTFGDDRGVLSQTALITAHDYDQQSLSAQCMESPWVVHETMPLANEKLTQFLAFLDEA